MDLTRDEFARLFHLEVAGLDATNRDILTRYSVPVFRAVYEDAGVSGPAQSPAWVVARAGGLVLAYDEVDEAYGIGDLGQDGIIRDWGTYGERLAWALPRLLRPSPCPLDRSGSLA